MDAAGKPFWRVLSKPGAKPLFFVPNLWKSWNSRIFSDFPRMRSQNLVFEVYNVPNSSVRKISLVSRPTTTRLNTNVSMILERYGVEKPQERGHKKTVSLGIWSLENNKIPPIPEFEEVEEVRNFFKEWDELNDNHPTRIVKDIHKKVTQNLSIRNEIREEFFND